MDTPLVARVAQTARTRWDGVVRSLADPNMPWADDDGTPDPAVRVALGAALADQDSRLGYVNAVVSLGGARLLIPIVATGNDSGDDASVSHQQAGDNRAGDNGAGDKQSELSAVTLEDGAGRRALVAFTGMDALQAWRPDARPVPGTLDEAAATAVELGAEVLVVDVAGPSPFIVGDDVLAQAAVGRRLVRLVDGGYGWASRT